SLHSFPTRRSSDLGGNDRLDQADDSVHRLVGDGGDEFVLALEVPVNSTGRQVGLGEDVGHRCLVEALPDKAAPGSVEDLLTAALAMFIGHAWHGPHYKTNVPS